jgi:hypothetical protein
VALDRYGSPLIDRAFAWTSDKPETASVDDGGLVGGIAFGEAAITATSETVAITTNIVVSQYTWSVDSIIDAGSSFDVVWGTSASDVYAGGGGTQTVHYDGVAWSRATIYGGFEDIWGTSSSNVWAAGSNTLYNYDGSSWRRLGGLPGSAFLNGVWVAPAGEVFAVGCSLRILRGDGDSWQDDTHPLSGENGCLFDTWGTDTSNVWAVGGVDDPVDPDLDYGVVLHWDGSSWQVEYVYDDDRSLRAVWGSPDGASVFVGGYGDGVIQGPGTWTPANLGTAIFGLSGTASDDVYGITDDVLFHFNGAEWEEIRVPLIDRTVYRGVWVAPTSEIFVVGRTSYAHPVIAVGRR